MASCFCVGPPGNCPCIRRGREETVVVVVVDAEGRTITTTRTTSQPARRFAGANWAPVLQWPTPRTLYDDCSCNPANGGSGICMCVRGNQVVYGGGL